MDRHQTSRALSHDEQHAAEAAFAGKPLNPKWSARARSVYEGILKALPPPAAMSEETTALAGDTSDAMESTAVKNVGQPEARAAEPLDTAVNTGGTSPTKIPFEEALASGALIDVTPMAKQVGLSFPVTVTKPLWDMGIAPSKTLSQEEQSDRLRDVLMAFRLRLTAQPTVSPLIDFPALLAFPPNTAPQPIPLFALVQPDEQNRAMVTLLLPNEVAATIIPLN